MTVRQVLMLGTSLVASFLFSAQRCANAESVAGPIVRIAELEIAPGQLDAYKRALKKEIETSIRVELGVLTLYAVSLKGHPEQIRLFETYKDALAYESHVQSPHFQKIQASDAADGETPYAGRNRAHSARLKIKMSFERNCQNRAVISARPAAFD